jgi:hypothetical protein
LLPALEAFPALLHTPGFFCHILFAAFECVSFFAQGCCTLPHLCGLGFVGPLRALPRRRFQPFDVFSQFIVFRKLKVIPHRFVLEPTGKVAFLHLDVRFVD